MKALSRLFAISFLLILSTCGGSGGGSVTVGVLNSDSGDLASFGASISSAIRLAEREVNRRLRNEGAGFSLRFVYKDAGTDPDLALQRMQEFLDEGIQVVIGPMSSAEGEAIQQFSKENGILLISPASTSESLAQADDLIIRPVGNDAGQAHAISAAYRYFGTTFYAPLWRGDSYGDSLVLNVGEQFERSGGRFAPGARYPSDTTDYTQYLDQLDEQVDAFQDFFGTSSVAIYTIAFDEINDIFTQAENYPRLSSVRWYGSDGSALNSSLLRNPTTAAFMSKTQMLSPIFAGEFHSDEFQRVRTLIEEEVGEKVKPYAVVAYDCVLLLAEAWKSFGSTEIVGVELRDEIIRISSSIIGATGNLSLDANGDRAPGDYELWQIVSDGAGGYSWQLGGIFDVPESGFEDGQFIKQ